MKNLVILVGRLGNDPEFKTTQSGKAACSFSLATDRGYGESKTTDWHNIKAYGDTAENVCKLFKKGDSIFIRGNNHPYSYTDKSGKKCYSHEVIIDGFDFIGGKAPEASKQAETTPSAEAPVFAPIEDGEDLPF